MALLSAVNHDWSIEEGRMGRRDMLNVVGGFEGKDTMERERERSREFERERESWL